MAKNPLSRIYLREIKAGNQTKKRGEEDRLNVISAQLYMGVEDTLMGVHHCIRWGGGGGAPGSPIQLREGFTTTDAF